MNERSVAGSTHRQALSALLFFYGKVVGSDLPWMAEIGQPSVRRRLPVVLSRDEVVKNLTLMKGEHRLLAHLLYGTGLHLAEALQLRVKDVDFAHRAIVVREGTFTADVAIDFTSTGSILERWCGPYQTGPDPRRCAATPPTGRSMVPLPC